MFNLSGVTELRAVLVMRAARMFEIVKRNAFGQIGPPSPDQPATARRPLDRVHWQAKIVFAKAKTVFLE